MDTNATTEEIILHTRFLRRLAADLLGDTDAAKDVVQEAQLRALGRPELEVRSVRAWSSRVVRRLALDRLRGEERRSQREALVARAESVPDPQERDQRLVLQERILAHVRALEEPMGSVIYLRYYECLKPREIARRFDMPVATVKTRLKRGLQKLRARLDAEEERTGQKWALALLPFVPRAGSPGLPFALAGGALFVVLSSVVVYQAERGAPESVEADGARPTVAQSVTAVRDFDEESVAPSREPQEPASRIGEQDRSGSAILRGRLLLPNGKPAEGVELCLRGWATNDDEVAAVGRSAKWENLDALSAEDGSFELCFSPPAAFQFTLETKFEGRAQLAWRWGDLRRGEARDLGDLVLQREARVQGRVVLASGNAPGPEWHVYVEELAPLRNGRNGYYESTNVEEGTGKFELGELPAGNMRISLYHKIRGWRERSRFEVQAGQTTTLRIEAADDDLGLVPPLLIRGGSDHTHFQHPMPEYVRLIDDSGAEHVGVFDDFQSFAFPGLPIGNYRLVIDDPRFLPVDEEWSEELWVEVVGSSSVRLNVFGEEPGTRLTDYSLAVRSQYGDSPRRLRDQPHPLGGRYDDMVAGSEALVIRSPGYEALELSLAELVPGEELELTGTLTRTVLSLDHEPAPGTAAFLEGRLIMPRAFSARLVIELERVAGGSSDEKVRLPLSADGSFASEGLPAEPHRINLALLDGQVALGLAELAILELEPGRTRIELSPGTRLPGALSLEVLVDGEPQPLGVEIIDEISLQELRVKKTDETGAVRLEYFGGKTRLMLAHADWDWIAVREVNFPSGETRHLRLDVETHAGVLRFVDDVGRPWTNDIGFAVKTRGASLGWVLTPDANGELSVALPEATYVVDSNSWPRGRFHPEQVEWTEEGPIPATVTIVPDE